ncbi:MAG: protein kinase [Candidatus Saccharibacteria bacterium]|nr:protein kinase [Candidatus Saccharibacteria bacterium]
MSTYKSRSLQVERDIENKLGYKILKSDKSSQQRFSYTALDKAGEKVHLKIINLKQTSEEGLMPEANLLSISKGARNVVDYQGYEKISPPYRLLKFTHIEGETLKDLDLNQDELKKLALQITQAIADLWKKRIVHRDIKPNNIMRDKAGNFILLDLGIGYYISNAYKDKQSTKIGKASLYYSPPEHHCSYGEPIGATFANDLYSLGLVLYEKLMRYHPSKDTKCKSHYEFMQDYFFNNKSINIQNPTNDNLINFINTLLETHRIHRFSSPENALKHCLFNATKKPNLSRQRKNIFFNNMARPAGILENIASNFEKDQNKPNGFILPIRTAMDKLEHIQKRGYEIILNLPIDTVKQEKKEKEVTIDLLINAPKKEKKFKWLKVNKDNENEFDKIKSEILKEDSAYQDLIKTIFEEQRQKGASILILPHFTEKDCPELIKTHQKLWESFKKNHYQSDTKKIYGEIEIPYFVTSNKKQTYQFTNAIQGSYDLDGFLLKFQFSKSIKTIDNKQFLENMLLIINFFKGMGDIIINQADISHLLLCPEENLSLGVSQTQRRFLNGGGGGGFEPKMQYYCSPLLTFIDEESRNLIAGVVEKSEELKQRLACQCNACLELKPYTGGKSNRRLEYQHYIQATVQQYKLFQNYSSVEQSLKEASDIKTLCEKKLGLIKGIPNYEVLLEVINERIQPF